MYNVIIDEERMIVNIKLGSEIRKLQCSALPEHTTKTKPNQTHLPSTVMRNECRTQSPQVLWPAVGRQ